MLINKINEIVKTDLFKKILILSLLLIAVIIIFILVIKRVNSDGMVQTKGISIKYRTYTRENGWSKWSKNGKTSGNDNAITKIEIKTRKKGAYSTILYYKDGKWTEINKNNENSKVYGVQISDMAAVLNKYDLCYRTYNDKNKWMDWVCDGSYSGNSKFAIKKIEIKFIPKKILRYQYLKDYTENDLKYIGF